MPHGDEVEEKEEATGSPFFASSAYSLASRPASLWAQARSAALNNGEEPLCLSMQLFLVLAWACLAVAQQVTIPLNNSIIATAAIESGDLQHFYFSASSTSLLDRRRLATRDVPNLFLTLTSCSQPTPPANYEGEIPSLDVFLSTSEDNTLPGPSQGLLVNDTLFGRVAWENTEPISKLWIGVVAPTLTENWNGNWTFQIAVSTEGVCE